MHSNSKTERLWFSHLLESESLPSASDVKPLSQFEHAQKKRIHSLLASSEVFDNFLQAKFPNLKRVSKTILRICDAVSDVHGFWCSTDWKVANR